MAYPEKISFQDKVNRRPLVDPDGQVTANEINEFRDKLNANALFHDVHDNLPALQLKFPNPPKGAFAYLLDGSCYRCVSVGWTTDPVSPGGGGGETYFKGYYTTEDAVRTAYPDGQPGWRAIVRVQGGIDKEGLWDEDDGQWFFFSLAAVTGGDTASPTRLDRMLLGYDSGLDYYPKAFFTIDGISKTDTRALTLAAADATNPRIDTFVVNINTSQIEVITGTPAANPSEPDIDFAVYLKGPIVLVPAGADAPAGTEITNVYQENAGTAGGEFDAGGGADYDFANNEDPAKGAVAVKVVDQIQNNQNLTFLNDTDLPISQAKELHFQIKNINAGDFYVRIRGKRANGSADSIVLPVVSNFGYDPNNTANYQKIVLPVDQTILATFNQVNITCKKSGWQYFIDDIRCIGGEGTPTNTGDYVTLEQFQLLQERVTELEGAGGGGTSYVPPSPYANMQAMYDAQANQVANQTYRVTDASAHSEVQAGRAWFEYIGTTSQDKEDDYILKSEEESLNLDQQFAALQAQITDNANAIIAHNTRLNALEAIDNIVTVDTSRLLAASDIGKVLYVIASVTLTWPAAGIPGFKANLECNDTGAATIADEAGTPGDDLSSPNGTEIAADETAYLFVEPVGSKLRISK